MIFGPSEYKERVKKIQISMETQGFNALVLQDINNIIYTSGYEPPGSGCAVIIPRDRDPTLLFSPLWELERAKGESWIEDIRASQIFHTDLSDFVEKEGIGKGKLGFDTYGTFPIAVQEELRKTLNGIQLASAANILNEIREVKSPLEISITREIAKINDKLDDAFFDILKEGKSEAEIHAELIYKLQLLGGRRIHVSMTTGFPNFWMHYKPYPRRLKRGDLVFCEIAPQYKGYWTETIRMAVVGKPVREYRDLFQIEMDALDHVIKDLKPGAIASDIYKSLLDMVGKTGIALMEYVDTMTHGAGLTLGDLPNIRYDTKDVVKEGQSLCIHPILVLPYIGSEFMVGEHAIVNKNGVEIITKRQRELIVV